MIGPTVPNWSGLRNFGPYFWTNMDNLRVVGKGSWEQREVGKSDMELERMKLESSVEVGKFWFNLGRINEVGKVDIRKVMREIS